MYENERIEYGGEMRMNTVLLFEKEKLSKKGINSCYYEHHFLSSYDYPFNLSARLREDNDNYMKEYRKYLKKVCDFSRSFEENLAKATISEYVNLTVNSKYRTSPQDVFGMVKAEVKIISDSNMAERLEDLCTSRRKCITIDCYNCKRKIRVPEDFHSFEIKCIECFRKENKKR